MKKKINRKHDICVIAGGNEVPVVGSGNVADSVFYVLACMHGREFGTSLKLVF